VKQIHTGVKSYECKQCGKPSISPVALEHMNKFIVVRKPMYASNVEKLLLHPGTLKHMNT
jgi:hypothetical protein